MNHATLYEEYRLIERNETTINRAWKGAHLLLFFLAFVFGSFCTFCFHMLMYLFDEKCVLFPKLLSLTSLRHNVIYEFIPSNQDLTDLPVDFISTQWVEKSTCSLPTYVPLVSGIFGLVWTTMFHMCSTGSRTLTGLQRPWRVLPPVILFSLVMGGLCLYSSAITHSGLQELCIKLGEITGSSTCSYTVNVATLAYEGRIRAVYQTTRLTIVSAWLHTACWILSALLAVTRVLLAVDFQLVRVKVSFHGDVDKLLERNETQIRTISPDELWMNTVYVAASDDESKKSIDDNDNDLTELLNKHSEALLSDASQFSYLSLTPEERDRLDKIFAYKKVAKDEQFIVKMVYDLVDNIGSPDSPVPISSVSPNNDSTEDEDSKVIARQFGRQSILSESHVSGLQVRYDADTAEATGGFAASMYHKIKTAIDDHLLDVPTSSKRGKVTTSTAGKGSSRNETDKSKEDKKRRPKFKNTGSQTSKKESPKRRPKKNKRVVISERNLTSSNEDDNQQRQERRNEVDKETQTRNKEKQD